MVRDAEQVATLAEHASENPAGYCLVWSRELADIPARYGSAAAAWRAAHRRHRGDRTPPRGAMCFWTGGSHGYGHIAPSLGKGVIRSSDAGGQGRPATVPLGWVEEHWGLTYEGWTDNVNDIQIPGVGDDNDMDLNDKIVKWSPGAHDDAGKEDGQTTVGKTLNQARGYAEGAYQRLAALEEKVDQILATLDQRAKAHDKK